ncbi:hypothetical protein [Streptomyces sp. NPDC058279]|uniref:hypothetical protein n=1 Tax=Streptomyces sp. NPDC058279 TaxID=3346418 RepID=UPI0036EF9E2D
MRVRVGTVLAVLLCAAGCGPGATAPGPGVTDGVVASAGAGCVHGADATVTEGDNGRRICLDRHGTVRVSLEGNPAPPVSVTGPALAEVSDHVFRGASAGTAVLTSAVRDCPEPTPAAPGSVGCLAMVLWQVTVVVK